ncbi:glutamine synthetase [Gammaproteobacteria bacterium]|nr:glutamine synthetase [Gammaproteobacteria bacterium]
MELREINTPEDLKETLTQLGTKYIKVAVTDIDGVLRGKYIHVDKFLKASNEGFGFCDVIFGWDSEDELYEFNCTDSSDLFTGWNTGFPDLQAKIVLNSGRNVPFEENTPFFLSELESAEVCPRGILKKILSRLEEHGLKAKSAFEYEFFLFDETPKSIRDKDFKNLENFTPGMFGYSILRSSVHSDLYQEILSMCLSMDMHLEGLHTETGPGVIEAAITVDDALLSADKAILFKTFMKVLAQRNNLMANFMAKWSENYPGQSGHIHASLQHLNGESAFTGSQGETTETMTYFLGGLQRYMREFSCLIAPTVNSYKRLCPGAWAPINMTWGEENRTTGLRVIKGGPSSQRIENRLPGADSNPYLALAATLGAGCLGIEQKIQPTEETIGTAYSLKVPKKHEVPGNLEESSKLFRMSESARSLFGDSFVNHFSNTRKWEHDQFLKNSSSMKTDKISQWELARYFEII